MPADCSHYKKKVDRHDCGHKTPDRSEGIVSEAEACDNGKSDYYAEISDAFFRRKEQRQANDAGIDYPNEAVWHDSFPDQSRVVVNRVIYDSEWHPIRVENQRRK